MVVQFYVFSFRNEYKHLILSFYFSSHAMAESLVQLGQFMMVFVLNTQITIGATTINDTR